MLSLQVAANGLELDSQGIARSLEPAAWRRLGRDMHDLVSPPGDRVSGRLTPPMGRPDARKVRES